MSAKQTPRDGTTYPGLKSLDDVRRVARAAGAIEIQFNRTSRVIAFQKSGGAHGKDGKPGIRINVWYTTGTVGTYLAHQGWGEKTQLFRRRVDLDLLQDIFRNPRKHTGLGYHFREEMLVSGEAGSGIGRVDTMSIGSGKDYHRKEGSRGSTLLESSSRSLGSSGRRDRSRSPPWQKFENQK